MKTRYADMAPIDIRIAILRSGTTQAAIARYITNRDGKQCTRELVSRVIDNKSVSHRVRTGIAEAIGIPVNIIWRSYYLRFEPGRRGRHKTEHKQSMTAAF